MEHFIEKIQKQLQIMTEKEKDAWIISQSRIAPEKDQEDFYKSICGTKKIIYMPEREKIDEFCEKVSNGEIVVEYETHYVEFDDEGYFHDDWEQTYYDPSGAMSFIGTVICGCHDLIILGEYFQAYEILNKIIRLEFAIEDAPDTEDTCQEECLTLHDACREGLIRINRSGLLRDYIEACKKSIKDTQEAARSIISAFEMELFLECKPYDCIIIELEEPILTDLKMVLTEDLKVAEKNHSEKLKQERYYLGQYRDQERISHIKDLIGYFEENGKERSRPKESFLQGTWEQIRGLMDDLAREPYIDDQVKIEEIWNIVEALIKCGEFEKESWDVKKKILEEIYGNDYFDYYGIYDPMKDLSEAMCSTREEKLKCAETMMYAGRGYLETDAARLYRELGEETKCVEYFEKHLGKEKEAYEVVMDYYKDVDHDKAVEIARLALDKCKDDQTPFFIFLLQAAKDEGDESGFKKLMQSAHRRRTVKSTEIDALFSV